MAVVIEQYTSQVKPAFERFVRPSRKHADVIIPWSRRVLSSAAVILRAVHPGYSLPRDPLQGAFCRHKQRAYQLVLRTALIDSDAEFALSAT